MGPPVVCAVIQQSFISSLRNRFNCYYFGDTVASFGQSDSFVPFVYFSLFVNSNYA